MLIGITGYARSGKDEAASILVKEFGFVRIAFADALREFLLAQDPWILDTYHPLFAFSAVKLSKLVDCCGWDGAKKIPEVRRLLQITGTECVRNIFGDTTWVDLAFKKVQAHPNVVITDCRFPNEESGVHEWGGIMWRISRPGLAIDADRNHDSERFVPELNVDYELDNISTLEAFHDLVRFTYYSSRTKEAS